MTEPKDKPRELTHESIQWVPKRAYASLEEKLRVAVEALEWYERSTIGALQDKALDTLAKIKDSECAK